MFFFPLQTLPQEPHPIRGRYSLYSRPDAISTALGVDPVRLLYLHGWNSSLGGVKPTSLRSRGHEVIEPALDHDDFELALATAQAAFDEHRPDVVVGSSRGGAVAMNLQSGHARLVLLCPAWKNWGSARRVKPGTTILHSRGDDVIPFEESLELVWGSGLPDGVLVEVGTDHRLADPEPLRALARAVEG